MRGGTTNRDDYYCGGGRSINESVWKMASSTMKPIHTDTHLKAKDESRQKALLLRNIMARKGQGEAPLLLKGMFIPLNTAELGRDRISSSSSSSTSEIYPYNIAVPLVFGNKSISLIKISK